MNTSQIFCKKRCLIPLTTLFVIFLPQLSVGAILEEVVVTAQKRSQDIQDVGIAITAFSGEQMKALGFDKSTDVARFSPGVHLSADTGGHKTNFTIRGVAQNDPLDTAEPPVAVYVDEGYVAALNGQIFGLWDVDRVEIAKGPQGTLFGRNATGGLVHFISRKPTDEFEAFVDLTYGSYDKFRAEAAISGPLTDTVKARLSGFTTRHDGLYESELAGSPDLGDDDTWGVRGHVQFEPNDDVEILLSGYASRTELNSAPADHIPTASVFDGFFREVNTVFATVDNSGFTDGREPDFRHSANYAFKDQNKLESAGGSAKITWNFDNFTLTSITDLKKFDKETGLDGDNTPIDQLNVLFEVDSLSIAQELRLSGETEKTRWVTGLYYLNVDNKTEAAFQYPLTSITFGGAFNGLEEVSEPDVKVNSYSIFGQLEYDLTNEITLIAGLRVVREEKNLKWLQNAYVDTDPLVIDTGIVAIPFAAPVDVDNNETLWTGKLQLDWRPNDDLLLYAGVNRGVKAGGFNHPIPVFAGYAGVIPYQEEVLLSYEAGFKSTLFDGTTRFNASFFYYDYQDFQASQWQTFSNFIINRDAENYGIDLELISNPFEGWDIMLTAGWVDTKVKDVTVADVIGAGVPIIGDVEVHQSPELTLAGLVRYEFPNQYLNGKFAVQVDYNYASGYFSNLRNFDAHVIDEYVVGNASISWASVDGHWDAKFYINNFTDARYTTARFDNSVFFGVSQNILGYPRWFGGTVRYNW